LTQTLAPERLSSVARSLLNDLFVNVSLFQAAAALDANSRWQEIIADNLASSSVPGYKQQQLSQAAVQAGLMSASNMQNLPNFFSISSSSASTDFSAGELKYTGNNGTDVAIEGKGFFEVRLPNGSLGLTRDGEFRISSRGQLVSKESHPVMGINASGVRVPIQLNADHSGPLSISSTGNITQGSELIGHLSVTDVDNPHLLTPLSGGYFLAQNPKITQTQSKSNLREGYLEASNSSTLMQMASMMTASRGFEANQKVIQLQDDRLNHVITELGNPTS
jgi:flagellar basal body rod protein FlgG